MWKGIFFIWILLELVGGHAWAAPPVGQRRYMIDQGSPYAPVRIQGKSGPAMGAYLKDPIQIFPSSKASSVAPVKLNRNLKRRVHVGQLRFKKLPVAGATSRPRTEFVREILPINRADEPILQDFFDKVFKPNMDRSY